MAQMGPTGHDHDGRMITTVRVANPGPMTLDGTNTYLLGGGVVVDPGPHDASHADAITAAVKDQWSGPPNLILLTHRHLDHSESALELAERWTVPVRAADPTLCVGGGRRLEDGSVITSGGATITVLLTPGHTDDSVCLLVAERGRPTALLSGDTVLGRGTTVIAEPDGDLGAYLTSLDRLGALVVEHQVTSILPGHGPVITDPVDRIAGYQAHRRERLDQFRAALARGAITADDVVDLVYADVDPAVRPAALQSVRAQLAYLDVARPR